MNAKYTTWNDREVIFSLPTGVVFPLNVSPVFVSEFEVEIEVEVEIGLEIEVVFVFGTRARARLFLPGSPLPLFSPFWPFGASTQCCQIAQPGSRPI